MDCNPSLVINGSNFRTGQQTNPLESEARSTTTSVPLLNISDIKNAVVILDSNDRHALNSIRSPRLQQILVIAHDSTGVDVRRSPLQENVVPHIRQKEEDQSNTKQKQESKHQDAMLLNYLDQMKRRRLELQALNPRPEWALVPVARIHNTSYATDEESKEIGDTLHDFFNNSMPTNSSQEIHENILDYNIKQEDILVDVVDVVQPEVSPSSNAMFYSSSPSSPLVPNLPNFKHTTISLMMEELRQGLKEEPEFETPTSQFRSQVQQLQQPASFLSLNDTVRKEIWALALQRPRIIELTISYTHSIFSRAAIPALLHTCQESRAVAQEHSALSFGTDNTSPKVYFDFKHDWVYTRCSGCLGPDCKHKLTLTDDHKKLKHLIFEGLMTYNPFQKILRFYPNVENLVLIGGRSVGKRDRISKENISFIDRSFDWARQEGLMALARKAWIQLEPSGERPLPLKHIWRATLPGVVDDVKRSSDATKGLWTCCS